MTMLMAQAVSSGLALGAIYALAASGLGIIFGLFGVINFAHTQNMMIAAIAAIAASAAGAPFVVAIVLGVLTAAVLGALTERLFIRPLLSNDTAQIDTLFVTLGLSIVIENVALLMWGSQPKYFDTPLHGIVDVGGVVLTVDRILTMAVAALVFIALHLLTTRTRWGKAVLATAQNPIAAEVIGIPVARVRLIAFAFGAGLAGLGGIFWGMIYSVSYITGATFLILSFVLVVMSGPGNITGILVCSLLLGVTESVAGAIFDAKWQRLAVMLVFILLIVRRPQGLGQGRLTRSNI
jgi:branched-subunit amino acid ABC-type transport system permease component